MLYILLAQILVIWLLISYAVDYSKLLLKKSKATYLHSGSVQKQPFELVILNIVAFALNIIVTIPKAKELYGLETWFDRGLTITAIAYVMSVGYLLYANYKVTHHKPKTIRQLVVAFATVYTAFASALLLPVIYIFIKLVS